MRKSAASKPGPPSGGKFQYASTSKASSSSGARLWEKKPTQGFKKSGGPASGKWNDGKAEGERRYEEGRKEC
jgi:hypothetical protein